MPEIIGADPEAGTLAPCRILTTERWTVRGTLSVPVSNALGDPPALPGRQHKFDIFGSVLHSIFIGFEKAVHVHEHANVYVDVHVLVDVAVDGLWRIRLRSSPFEGPATAKSPAVPEDTYQTDFF